MTDILSLAVAVLSLVVTCIALYAAWLIPQRIMVNQQYSELAAAYRSTEMGNAIHSIIDFYVNVCKCCLNDIEKQYENQFDKDFKQFHIKELQNGDFKYATTLHFKRRLVDQYFWLIGELAFGKTRLIRLPKRELRNWFTENESKVLYIIAQMNIAARKRELEMKNLPDYTDKEKKQTAMMDEIRKKLYDESKKWREA